MKNMMASPKRERNKLAKTLVIQRIFFSRRFQVVRRKFTSFVYLSSLLRDGKFLGFVYGLFTCSFTRVIDNPNWVRLN